MQRRTYLKTAGGVALTGLLAGCSGDSGGDGGGNGGGNGGSGNTVAVGPESQFVFEPETITVSKGDTVTWEAKSSGHNVECAPQKSQYAALPDGAEPFASYEGDNRFGLMDEGTTYEYTFDVAGTYDYVCVPHAGQGMRGTVVVEE